MACEMSDSRLPTRACSIPFSSDSRVTCISRRVSSLTVPTAKVRAASAW